MVRKSTKADKEIAERNADEEDAFQGALPGMQPAEQVNRPDIEAAAIALDRAKTKATKAGVTKKDANDTLDGLMKHYNLAEYVLSDGRFVRPRGELHFDVVKENTGRRKKARGKGRKMAMANDLDLLAERALAESRRRNWSRDWSALGCYLHLESSELIEALRGKRGDSLEEAADVLFVLLSGLAYHGILASHAVEILNRRLPKFGGQSVAICDRCKTLPKYEKNLK